MPAAVLLAGLDRRSLPEVPVLQRGQHVLEELPGARALFVRLLRGDARLLVLGPALGDARLSESVRRIRSSPSLRQVSILAVLPESASGVPELLRAGANAVLRRPLDPLRYETWLTRLLAVPQRVAVRVPVKGEVLAMPRRVEGVHFSGLTRNLSLNGMLLASPVSLQVGEGSDLDLELSLGADHARFRAIGRVVRAATEITWPYLGYGIEFLFVPPESQGALDDFLAGAGAGRTADSGTIHSTVKRGAWIYEVLTPRPSRQGWQSEIRRAAREQWRPGEGGPYYVVHGGSPEEALRAARSFLQRQT